MGKTKMNTSMDDVIYDLSKPQAPPKFYFNTSKPEKVVEKTAGERVLQEKAERAELERQEFLTKLEEENQNIINYNNNINNISSLYLKFKPVDALLVRVFVRELLTTSKLIAAYYSDMICIPNSTAGGCHHTITDPYRYDSKAMIVCTPENERFYKPGEVVNIPHALVKSVTPIDANLEVSWSFTHPIYGANPAPPQDKTNIHFGYLLLPRQMIKGWHTEEEIKVLNEV